MQNDNTNGNWKSDSVIVSLFMSLASLIGEAINGIATNISQRKHDKEMAQIELTNQKELMDYQNNLQQDTNQIGTLKGHMVSAGYSPALAYGSGSMQPAQVSGGSASAGANSLHPLNLFNRVPVDSISSTLLSQASQNIQADRVKAQNQRDQAETALAQMKTAREYYDAQVSKKTQRVIVDQMYQNLENSRLEAREKRFALERANLLLPGELEQQGLINKATAKQAEESASRILHNTWENRALAANIKYINSQDLTEGARHDEIRESIRGAALGRVMSEFGLNNRLEPSVFRNRTYLMKSAYAEQMKGAVTALVAVGYDPREAAKAVLYYVAPTSKDVSPSLINAFARMASVAMK